MKILLASKYGPHGARPIGGVQTWVATVARVLVSLGHEVDFYEAGQKEPGKRYDLGIFANMGHTGHMLKRCNHIIQISHGIIEPEKPTYPKVAFTSEGVRDFWKADGPIIRQPIDLDFWRPAKGCEKKYLTRFSYRKGLDFVPKIADRLGLEYIHLTHFKPELVRQVLRKSACVLATGRAALEAMACGVPVVICDHRSAYQGPLMDRDLVHAMRNNYSGRGGIKPDAFKVQFAIKQAIFKGSLRSHVQQFHDAEKIVNQIMALKWEAAPGCKLKVVA